MKCEQITPYLPGYVGGDIRADTTRVVAEHLASCAACRAETGRQRRVAAGLRSLSEAYVEPPPFLLDAVLESAHGRMTRRFLPVLPLPIDEVVRLVSEHRDVIASAVGTALVGMGAVYALWRAARGSRASQQPATP